MSYGAGNNALPRWIRLVRAGNVFTGYESSNGATWSQVGSVTLALPASLYVGLAVTSHNDGMLTTAVFDNVSFVGGSTPPPATTLPAPVNFTATGTSATTVALAWSDTATSETGFEIERSTDNSVFVAAGTAAANATSFTVTDLAPSTLNYFRVRTVQGTTTSAYTTSVSAVTFAAPPPTTGTWQSGDIGNVSAAGSASEAAGVVTLRASGEDIWGATDEFGFRYQALTGNGEIIARVTGLTNTHAWAKAGVMMRETLAANSRHAFMCVTPGNGVSFHRRAIAGGGTELVSGTSPTALPRWLRLVRNGTTITGYESATGTSWTPVGTLTVDLASTIFVGLALTSHNDGVIGTATLDNVSVTAGTTSTMPPPTTTGWSNIDVGTVGIAGSVDTGTNTYTVRGSGDDVWGSADAFRFLYRTLNGDCVVETQVTSLTNTHPWAKAGVMIRESLAPGARHVFLSLTPANGVVLEQRAVADGATSLAYSPYGTGAGYWVRLVRSGAQIASYVSADGVTWTQLQVYTFPTGSALVGFAVTSHDNTRVTTAVFADPFVQ
jgi:regulation of enolase protein 1 (concanavalin A-like superfamily)